MRALITGSSSGLGREIAYYLASLNIDLILVARRKKRLESIKDKVNVDVKIYSLDLSIAKNIYRLFGKLSAEPIDILINNAGFGLFGDFTKTSLEDEIEMIDLNIKATHIITKLFLLNNKEGYILNVSSASGFLAGPKMATYYATKNYILKLSLAIYEELRSNKSNISISVLCPGPFRSEFNKIAHSKFKLKSETSKVIAKYAIDKMFKRKLIIIPGVKIKLLLFLSRFLPYKLSLKIIYKIQTWR